MAISIERAACVSLNGTIDRLLESSVLIDMLAMKRQNLLRNRTLPPSLPYRDGLFREIQEFIPVSHDFFDDMEYLWESYTDAKRLHRASVTIMSDMCGQAEDRLFQLIDEELRVKLDQANEGFSALSQRPISGFLSQGLLSDIETFDPGKPTRQYAALIGRFLTHLDLEVQALELQIDPAYEGRNLKTVWGQTPIGALMPTLEPRCLRIGTSPYDGSVTIRYRYQNKVVKYGSIDTAMRAMVHAIDSERVDREEVADVYTKQIMEIMASLNEALVSRSSLPREQAEPLLGTMYGILADIGKGQIQDHFKIRAAFSVEAALRALNCHVPDASSYLVPQRTAVSDLKTARGYLGRRREATSDIELHLQRRYASLWWFRHQDQQRHEYLVDTVGRASSMISEENPAERNYQAGRNILYRAQRSLPKTTYYGYQRAKARMTANVAMLDEINEGIAVALGQRDRTQLYEWQRLNDRQTRTAEILSTARRSLPKGREDYIAHCAASAKGYLDALLARDFVQGKAVVKRTIEAASASQNAEEVIKILQDAQRNFFPENGVNWQKDGRRLTSGAMDYIQRAARAAATPDDELIALISEDLSQTQSAIAALNQIALDGNPALLEKIEGLTRSINDNMDLIQTDLANRTEKIE